jgi:proliferating cell nuclear antigen
MKLTLAEPKFLKDSIAIISDIVTEARFNVTQEAVELVAMDSANVAMVVFKLLSSAFVSYEVKNSTSFAINLNNFKQVLRRAKLNDSVKLEIEQNKLKIQFKSKSTRTFYLPLIDFDESEQKVPTLEFPITVTMPGTMLNEAIDDADIVAESVSFVAEPDNFSIVAEGDLSKADVVIPTDANVKIVLSGDAQKIRSKYAIDYLKKMMQGLKLTDKVVVKFNKDYPLKLEYTVLNKVMLAFVLAPRVDSD